MEVATHFTTRRRTGSKPLVETVSTPGIAVTTPCDLSYELEQQLESNIPEKSLSKLLPGL